MDRYRYPVRVSAHHDTPPNRWLWLVKWLLLVPHYVLLTGLWAAFVVVTLIAYVVVLATGRYRRDCSGSAWACCGGPGG